MTISSSLNAGVAGLSAQSSRLAAISDNIANSSTYGYKRAVTDFHSMVIGENRARYTAGGVRTTSSRQISQGGPLVASGSATDIAVRGGGMLPVTTLAAARSDAAATNLRMATTGSFLPDKDGYLTSPGGLVLLGWPAGADGTVPLQARDTAAGLRPVQINMSQMTGQPTTEMRLIVNLPAESTVAGSGAAPIDMSLDYINNLGGSAAIAASFTPTIPGAGASNEWTLVLRDQAAGGAVIGEYVMTFDDSRGAGGALLSVATTAGGAYDAATGQVSVTTASGPIAIMLGRPGEASGSTQLAGPFSPVDIGKNGAPAGTLAAVEVDEGGLVHAIFDTGVSRVLYQIPLISVPNVNGLTALDDQTYALSSRSGAMYLWNAGEGPTGSVVGFAREESATDVAAELTSLIQTQRAYSSNAKVIQTVDEMLQETTNLKR